MKAEKLPEPDFYTVGSLAEKWGCGKDYILNLALTGQLQLSVESHGWWLEMGSIEEHEEMGWFTIPDDFRLSNGELLRLSLRDQKEIVRNGAANDPSFKNDDFDYMRISSHHHLEEEIVINASDLVITKENAEEVAKSKAANLALVSEAAIPKLKRVNQLHELVGQIISDFKKSDKQPNAANLWKHIKDNQDEYEIIQKIEICQDKKEEAIFWISTYGSEQKMLKSTFANLVSAYNSRKKFI